MENQKKEVWLRKALFLIVSLALFFPMMAQTITVKGVVKESMTGEPIIGANVAVKGTTNGTISDISGMYQISNVSSNAVLIVSYIGYKTAEIPGKWQEHDKCELGGRKYRTSRSGSRGIWLSEKERIDRLCCRLEGGRLD